MFGVDVKKMLESQVLERIQQYEGEEHIATRYGDPLIGYVDSVNLFFDEFYRRGICMHPKEVYRPGETVIAYFVPFREEIAESNRGGLTISQEWTRAAEESLMLTAHINGTLRETLTCLGRNTSGTNLPGDWDDEKCGPNWSHKHAAFLAGLGRFGRGGSFHTSAGFAGCFGSVITDLPLEPTKLWTEEEFAMRKQICDEIEKAYNSATEEAAARCPAKAIGKGKAGGVGDWQVDRKACQIFCKGLDMPAPWPDLCAKCFYD